MRKQEGLRYEDRSVKAAKRLRYKGIFLSRKRAYEMLGLPPKSNLPDEVINEMLLNKNTEVSPKTLKERE